MAFQFNFDVGQDKDDDSTSSSNSGAAKSDEAAGDSRKTCDILRTAQEIYRPESRRETPPSAVETLSVGDLELLFLNPEDAEFDRLLESLIEEDSDVSKATENHSDLIPNVYEGGMKVWECSTDLVHYLHEAEVSLVNKQVLELGCGAGLPGIYAVKRGAAAVHFQDYNNEVIMHMTIPCVVLNQSQDGPTNHDLRFFAGDWSSVQQMLISSNPDIKYDVILTSETIYSVESHEKLYQILRTLLKPNGVIYIAAKTHYFGVGGGTRIFEDLVRRYKEFDIEVCKTFTEGVKKEILKMAFVQTSLTTPLNRLLKP